MNTSYKNITIYGAIAIAVVLALFLPYSTSAALGDIITLSQASKVTVTIYSPSLRYAAANNLIQLQSPNLVTIGYSKSDADKAVDLENFSSGTELVFSITTPDGFTYFTGSGSRNPDGLVHANVSGGQTFNGIQQWNVDFEDQYNLGDGNFGSVVFAVVAKNQAPACTYHAYQRCVGNGLYWYDSCGVQQDLVQYCQNGCSGNTCYVPPQPPQPVCTNHAYRLCQGNSIYWYNSCGTQQDIYQACGSNQICQNGQCMSNYVAHSQLACVGNSLYWYDSLGIVSGLYKNCGINQTCKSGQCVSAYVPPVQPTQPAINSLSVSFFTKLDANSQQWLKTTDINPDKSVYFMVTVLNNSTKQVDNVTVSANIPTEIASLGNAKLDNNSISGDIISGINISSIPASGSKSITFEGKTAAVIESSAKQAVATITVGGSSKSDTISLNFIQGQPAAVSGGNLLEFMKRWYAWVIAGFVLLILFVIVFKRLSTEA